jgi:LPS-assembly lipoprotein
MSRDASSTSLSDRRIQAGRRAFLGLGTAGLLGLSGCGFRPLYGSSGAATSGPVAAEFGAIDVARIPERSGQLMRRALQQRLWAGGQSSPRYTLTAFPAFGVELEGIRTSGLPTRIRFTGTASWWLTSKDVPPQSIASGAERSFDAYDLPDGQFFAADAARDAMMVRLIDQMAEDIVARLAIRFGERDAG